MRWPKQQRQSCAPIHPAPRRACSPPRCVPQGSAPRGRDFRAAFAQASQLALHNHLQGLYLRGHMALRGLGTPQDCTVALYSFYSLVLRMPPSPALTNAYELLVADNAPAALLEYARAAEMGSELAQWNAAFLMDHGYVPEATAATAPAAAALARAAPLVDSAGDAQSGFASIGSMGGVATVGGDGADAHAHAAPTSEEAGGTVLPGSNGGAVAVVSAEEQDVAVASSLLASWTPRFLAERLPMWALPHLASGLARLSFRPRSAYTSMGMQRRALRLYMRSAESLNPAAETAVGDAHYYGRGGLNASAAEAAKYYHRTCTAYTSPQVSPPPAIGPALRCSSSRGGPTSTDCLSASPSPPAGIASVLQPGRPVRGGRWGGARLFPGEALL